jgi:AraC family transcriptional regulator, regulatory protein of adaptative response / methylated-DNA-[protein]-cysteine methyltransferase
MPASDHACRDKATRFLEIHKMDTPDALALFRTPEDRLAAVRARDKTADGLFWYGVKTTGVFCKPSCAARPARVENISFHNSREAALAAGFRPCKRCKP